MNEKFRSKQTNFERTLICIEKFTTIFQSESKKTETKIVFRTRPKKAQEVTFKIFEKNKKL